MKELKICLIDPIDKNGHYNPKEAEPIDYIIVSLHLRNLNFLFIRVLIDHIELLLKRNGILPED